MLGFFIGILLGGIFGIVVMCLLQVGSHKNEKEDNECGEENQFYHY